MATPEELYTAVQQLKLYNQQNFPFKHTYYEGTVDPRAGAGLLAPVGAFYAQKSGTDLVATYIKQTTAHTGWEVFGAGGTGSGVSLWTPNTVYDSFATSGIPTLVWDTISAKIYYNTADFTSSASFAADQLLARWTELGAGGGANPMLPIGTWDMTGVFTPATISEAVIPPPYDQFVTNQVVIVGNTSTVSSPDADLAYGITNLIPSIPTTGKFYFFWSPGTTVGSPTTALNRLSIGDVFTTPLFTLSFTEAGGLYAEPTNTQVDAAFGIDDVAALAFDMDTGVISLTTTNVVIPDMSVIQPAYVCTAWAADPIQSVMGVQLNGNVGVISVSSRLSSTNQFGLIYTPPVGYLPIGALGDATPPPGVIDGNRYKVSVPGTFATKAPKLNDVVEFTSGATDIFIYPAEANFVNPAELDAAVATVATIEVWGIYSDPADYGPYTNAEINQKFIVGPNPIGGFATATEGQIATVASVTLGVPTWTFATPAQNMRILFEGVFYIYNTTVFYYPSEVTAFSQVNWFNEDANPQFAGLERQTVPALTASFGNFPAQSILVAIPSTTQYTRIIASVGNFDITSAPILELEFSTYYESHDVSLVGTIEIVITPLLDSGTFTVVAPGLNGLGTKDAYSYTYTLPIIGTVTRSLVLEYRISNGKVSLNQVFPTPVANIPVATSDYNGLMSAQDKITFDALGVEDGFNTMQLPGINSSPILWSKEVSTPYTESLGTSWIYLFQAFVGGPPGYISYKLRSQVLSDPSATWNTYGPGGGSVPNNFAYSRSLDRAVGILRDGSLAVYSNFSTNNLGSPVVATIGAHTELAYIVWFEPQGVFVAVSNQQGNDPKIVYSADGLSWTTIPSGSFPERYAGLDVTDEHIVYLTPAGSTLSLRFSAQVPFSPIKTTDTGFLTGIIPSRQLAVNESGIAIAVNPAATQALVADAYSYVDIVQTPGVTNIVYSKEFRAFIGSVTNTPDMMALSHDGVSWYQVPYGPATWTAVDDCVAIDGLNVVAKYSLEDNDTFFFSPTPGSVSRKADFEANQAIATALRNLLPTVNQNTTDIVAIQEELNNPVSTLTTSAGYATINLALGEYFKLTLTENLLGTVMSNPPGANHGGSIAILLQQDPVTPYTLAFTAGWKNADGASAPTLPANRRALLTVTSFDNWVTAEYTFSLRAV